MRLKGIDMKIQKYVMMMSLILLAAIAGTPTAHAAPLPALANYLRSEVLRARTAVAAEKQAGPEDGYFFKRWVIRLQAPFGVEVPWIAKFVLIPEIEMAWERPYPEGYTDYKP
jgi:hypothetical protein